MTTPLTPMPHQLAAVEFAKARTNSLIYGEAGVGKTLIGLTVAYDVLRAGGRVLWVTTGSLAAQLADDAGPFVASGLPAPTTWTDAPDGHPFIVTTPDLVRTRSHAFTIAGPWALIVFDEAHKAGALGQDPDSKGYTPLQDLMRGAGKTISMTGTPLSTHHALDLLGLAEIALPGIVDRAAVEAGITRNDYGPQSIDNAAFDRLVAEMKPHTFRARLADTGKPLPAIERTTHRVPLSPALAKKFEDTRRIWHDGKRFQERRKIANQEADLITHALGLITSHHARDQVLLYAETRELLKNLETGIRHLGIAHATITGDVAKGKRAAAAADFRAGRIRVLLITSAGELGLNAQTAKALISVVGSYDPMREHQREARLRRIGSPHREVAHHVIFADTSLVDHRDNKIARKEALIDRFTQLIDGPQSPGSEHDHGRREGHDDAA